MASMLFDDLAMDMRFETSAVTLTEDSIVQFAMQWDFHPLHVDRVAAEASPYGSLIASGLHTLVLSYRLFNQLGSIMGTAVGLELRRVRWPRPARVGDTLRTIFTVIELRESRSRPDSGVVVFAIRTINQEEAEVMLGELVCLSQRRCL